MNETILPIHKEKMTAEQKERLISSAEAKAGIARGRRFFTKRAAFIGIATALCLAAAGAGAFVLSEVPPVSANEDEYPDHRIIRDALNTGRYYLDGDTSAPYVEVYADGTLRLNYPGFEDRLRELAAGQAEERGSGTPFTAGQEAAISEDAAWACAPHGYTVVYWKFIDKTMVMLDWDEDSNEGGTGYDYIDRNTLTIGYGGVTFRYLYVG